MKSVLLDTNSYSRYAEGDKVVRRAIKDADEVLISCISVGELYAGFRRGVKFLQNEINLKSFLNDEKVVWLRVSLKTARIYGEVMVGLYKQGTPMPTNDVWIAAHVIESGVTLVTYDRHFLKIPGLKVWRGLK